MVDGLRGLAGTVLRWLPVVLVLSGAALASNGLPSTVTTISSSLNPAAEAQTVVFTAQVNIKDCECSPSGQVQFKDGGVNLGSPVTLVNGQATLGTTSLAVGNHNITATFLSNTSYNGSTSATLPELIYDCFVQGQFSAPVTINDNAAATPYPLTVTFSGIPGNVSQVQVVLVGFTHTFPDDVDMMLSSPSGANLVFMSDIGGGSDLTAATLTFSDPCGGCGTTHTPADAGPLTAGFSYVPTNIGSGDIFASPAPAPSSNTTFAGAFNGTNGNGDWKLWVMDDTAQDVGSFSQMQLWVNSGSGCGLASPASVLAANPVVSDEGSSVTFTLTMNPNTPTGPVLFQASNGSRTITLGSSTLSSGVATLTTSNLNGGLWTIKATSSGDSNWAFVQQTINHLRRPKRRLRVTSE